MGMVRPLVHGGEDTLGGGLLGSKSRSLVGNLLIVKRG
jgi:hypothetical protein